MFRALEKELPHDLKQDLSIAKLISNNFVPEFFKQIYNLQHGEVCYLKGVADKQSFLKLLEFFYCGKFLSAVTPY